MSLRNFLAQVFSMVDCRVPDLSRESTSELFDDLAPLYRQIFLDPHSSTPPRRNGAAYLARVLRIPDVMVKNVKCARGQSDDHLSSVLAWSNGQD